MPSSAPLDPAEQLFIEHMIDAWDATEAASKVACCNVATFARWLRDKRHLRLTEATEADCRAYLKHRAGVVAASTVVRNWSDLRAFYTACETDVTRPLGVGVRSPMADIKMPRAPKYAITHAATVAEVDAMIATFDCRTGLGLRNATMVSLMFRSGLRVSEASRAMLGDVDIDGRQIMLGLTKNLQPRLPSLHPETMMLLKRYLSHRGTKPGPLFVGAGQRGRGGRLPTAAIQNVVKRAAAKAAVPVSPHSLRRGFVVEYMTHGGDVATLMILGGWESEVMILRYMADARATTAQAVFDTVAQRQIASRRGLRRVS